MAPVLPRIHRDGADASFEGLFTDASQPGWLESQTPAKSMQELSQQFAAVQRNYNSLSLVVQAKQEELQQVGLHPNPVPARQRLTRNRW
jgi:hypothetical protein